MQSKLLRLNSRYRTQSSNSNTDFTISIGTQDLENVSRCTLLGVKIPRMFGNVYAGVNVLHATVTEFPEQPMPWSIVFPPGVYTSESLALELNRQIKLAYEWITRAHEIRVRRQRPAHTNNHRDTDNRCRAAVWNNSRNHTRVLAGRSVRSIDDCIVAD